MKVNDLLRKLHTVNGNYDVCFELETHNPSGETEVIEVSFDNVFTDNEENLCIRLLD